MDVLKMELGSGYIKELLSNRVFNSTAQRKIVLVKR
jgi:hypothetical protein